MAADFPKAGQVFGYHYLWKWQADRGETEGRKKRPICVAVVVVVVVVVVVNANGQHVMFIAPITSKEAAEDRVAVVIPETEARRAKLDPKIPLWVMVDELNHDIVEESYTLEERTPQGQFSVAFTDAIVRSVLGVRAAGKLRLADRT